LEDLYKDLQHSGAPDPIIQAIQHGFSSWNANPQSTNIWALTAGSLYGPDAVLTTAFYEQVHHIGWYHMCLGRVSKKWALAAKQYDITHSRDGGLQWASVLIAALWRYSKTLWRFRNEVVHGSTVEEQAKLQLQTLNNKLESYYQRYLHNPDIVLARHQFLFTSRSLEDRLKSSYDAKAAWLRSVEEAMKVLQHQEEAHRVVSQLFFPTRHNESDDSDSTYYDHSVSSDSTLSFDPTLPTAATTNTLSSATSSDIQSMTFTLLSDAEDCRSVLSNDSVIESIHDEVSYSSGDVESISVAYSTATTITQVEINAAKSTVHLFHSFSDATNTSNSTGSNSTSKNKKEHSNEVSHYPSNTPRHVCPKHFPSEDKRCSILAGISGSAPTGSASQPSDVEESSVASLPSSATIGPHNNLNSNKEVVELSSVASSDTRVSIVDFSDVSISSSSSVREDT
jgi:hypothetical protein